MKNLLIVFIVIIVAGCSTGSSPDRDIIDVTTRISYLDKQGDNLLNPEHPNAITEQNTNLYYLENGQKKKYYEGNLDHPKHFFIDDDYDDMHLFPKIKSGQDHAVTLIEFSDSTMDTIKVTYRRDDGSIFLTKVWYNQELKPEGENGFRFKVTKNF